MKRPASEALPAASGGVCLGPVACIALVSPAALFSGIKQGAGAQLSGAAHLARHAIMMPVMQPEPG